MPEQWSRIDSVLQSVLICPPAERDALVRRACRGDAILESEVRSLLASYEAAESFLERPAIHVAAQALAGDASAATVRDHLIGSFVSHYVILEKLGGGGMGVVYKAEDRRLQRFVAIKFLSEKSARAPESVSRFRREARAASALNHPNICLVHDIGEHEGHPFIVMELLEGTTLKERLVAGPIAQDLVVRLGLDVLDALEAAHRAGIAHRDIKPANIFITRRDHAKLLDFGVAKVTGTLAVDDGGTAVGTGAGTVLGTAAYMAPEQARGEAVDSRADLWAFGVVLYEMIVGVRPIAGLRAHANVPPPLERIIAKCLEPDLSRRYQHAADVRADLEPLARASDATAPPPVSSDSRRISTRWTSVVAAVALTAMVGAAILYVARSTPAADAMRLEYTQLTDFTDSATAPALSPDGRMVTFIRGGELCCVGGHGQIYVKALPSGEPVRLTNDDTPKYAPVFTPDASRITFTSFPWDIWSIPVQGGAPIRLLSNAFGLTWIGGGRTMFSEIKGSGIHMGIVTATENRADHREIYYPAHERGMAHFSHLSPDGKSVLVVEMDQTGAFGPCHLVPFDGGGQRTVVGPQGSCVAAAWSPDGRWMYFSGRFGSGSHLWRQAFPAGTPEQMTSGPSEEEGVAITPDGRSLITSIGMRQSAVWLTEAGADRAISSEGYAGAPRLSADGKRMFYLVSTSATSTAELRSVILASGKVEKVLPAMPIEDYDISSDEKEIAYTIRSSGESQIWLASFDHVAAARLVTRSGDQVSFGANGELIFKSLEAHTNFLARIDKDGSGRAHVFATPIADKRGVSRDGEWTIVTAAVQSERAFDTLAIPVHGGAPRKVCPPGCQWGVWSSNGRFFYLENLLGRATARTLAIPIASGKSLPDFPVDGLNLTTGGFDVPGTRALPHDVVSPGPDPSTYAFVKGNLQRNLFQIRFR